MAVASNLIGSVVVAFPTANMPRAAETLRKWSGKGYRTAVLLNRGDGTRGEGLDLEADFVVRSYVYAGFYDAQNYLARLLASLGAIAVVCGNDDIDPDPLHDPMDIALECGRVAADRMPGVWVMQPTGDVQGQMKHEDGRRTSAAQRICGSPWFSPEYIRRGYLGRGPFPTEYHHFGGDEEMKDVAERLGILQQRDDLLHFHRHHSWGHTEKMPYQSATVDNWYTKDRKVYLARKAAGFPGSDLA